jgi:hypothetical protein
MRLTILAAALAVASLSSSFAPAFAAEAGTSSPIRSELGVDISDAGNTHAEVRRFLASLEPETRRAVIEGCRHFLKEPVTAEQSTTIPFCEKAL